MKMTFFLQIGSNSGRLHIFHVLLDKQTAHSGLHKYRKTNQPGRDNSASVHLFAVLILYGMAKGKVNFSNLLGGI